MAARQAIALAVNTKRVSAIRAPRAANNTLFQVDSAESTNPPSLRIGVRSDQALCSHVDLI